jgi:hypothetical protein
VWTLPLLAIALAGCTKTPPRDPEIPADGPSAAASDEHSPLDKHPAEVPTRRAGWKPFREWGVRETTIDALARIGKPAVPALVEALHDPNPDLRDQAALALARIGPDAEAAVPDLIAALNDDNEVVRKDAVRALGQIGPQAARAVPELIEVLRRAEATMPAPEETNQRGARNSERGAKGGRDKD